MDERGMELNSRKRKEQKKLCRGRGGPHIVCLPCGRQTQGRPQLAFRARTSFLPCITCRLEAYTYSLFLCGVGHMKKKWQ